MRNPRFVVHLFLKDLPRLLIAFINRVESMSPDRKEPLESIKQKALQQLKKLYGQERFEEWRKEGLNITQAILAWSTKEELQRQEEALKTIKKALYDALACVEGELVDQQNLTYADIPKIDQAMMSLYHFTLREISRKRLEDISASGQIDLRYHFIVPIEGSEKRQLDVTLHTRQFSQPFISAMDARNDPSFVHPISALVEEIHIKTPDGRQLFSKKLRTATFDFHGIRVNHPLVPFSNEETAEALHELLKLSDEDLKQYIITLRMQREPGPLQLLVDTLFRYAQESSPPEKIKPYLFARYKYKKELEDLLNDEIIIESNTQCIQEMIDIATEGTLGFSIPQPVLAIFNTLPALQGNAWGMVNLQPPFNILCNGGINYRILKKARQQGVPEPTLEDIFGLELLNVNELDSIYREMVSYRKAAESRKISQALFFNFPTRFHEVIGKLYLRDHSVRYRMGPHLIYSGHDLAFYAEVQAETTRGVQAVVDRAKQAIESLSKSADSIIKHYSNTLKCLLEQTIDFSTTPKLKFDTHAERECEAIARFTLLMEMLNMKVTVNSRSGTNRTTDWLAKSNQLLAALSESKEGLIPSPEVTATVLDPSTYNEQTGQFNCHWSYLVYLESYAPYLELQKAIMGIKGTKQQFSSLAHPALSRALTRGATDVAKRFDPDAMHNARNK